MTDTLGDDFWASIEAEYAEAAANANQPIAMPREVWDAGEVLRNIERNAHGRLRSPDAVLGTVIALRAGQIPPNYQIPPIAGGNGSLNTIVGYVSHAGGGKSSTYSIGRDLVPLANQRRTKADAPIGSGEGIAELFYDIDDEKVRRCGPTTGGTNTVAIGALAAPVGDSPTFATSISS